MARLKVEGYQSLIRDTNSNGIVNTNTTEYSIYMARARAREKQGDEVLDIDFKDYKFSVSDLPEFTSFQIKVVFNGTNSAYPARLKDLRAIALAV